MTPREDSSVQEVAQQGVTGHGSTLPHLEQIQASFGHHDVSHVRAHVGGAAATASKGIGAEAYATGDNVAFPDSPSLHLAAHEAAHTVQQRGGVQLSRGVGEAGDRHERHADEVADRVAQGKSAEGLLDTYSAASVIHTAAPIQRKTPSEGSGEWNKEAKSRGVGDHATWALWKSVAVSAEAIGLTNAGRHMSHYLENTGATLSVNVDNMMRDVPRLANAFQLELRRAKAHATKQARSLGSVTAPQTFHLTGERSSDVYCDAGSSQDWFFAVGGFSYWHTAEVTALPDNGCSGPQVEMRFKLHVYDRYNWDQGKSISLAKVVKITDAEIGRLHKVGLAREYDVEGASTEVFTSWALNHAADVPGPGPASPKGRDFDGSRADVDRDRDPPPAPIKA